MGKRKLKENLQDYVWSPEVRRIIPLKAGYVYINDVTGKLNHVRIDSERFQELIQELSKNLTSAQMEKELARVRHHNPTN